jgi:hypothetical protein
MALIHNRYRQQQLQMLYEIFPRKRQEAMSDILKTGTLILMLNEYSQSEKTVVLRRKPEAIIWVKVQSEILLPCMIAEVIRYPVLQMKKMTNKNIAKQVLVRALFPLLCLLADP